MFSMKPDELSRDALQMDGYERVLRNVSVEVERILFSSGISSSAYRNVQRVIQSRQQYIQKDAECLGNLKNGLQSIVKSYNQSEQDILKRGKSVRLDQSFPNIWGSPIAIGALFATYGKIDGTASIDFPEKKDDDKHTASGGTSSGSTTNSGNTPGTAGSPTSAMDKLKDLYFTKKDKVDTWVEKHSDDSYENAVEKTWSRDDGWKNVDTKNEDELDKHTKNAVAGNPKKLENIGEIKIASIGTEDSVSFWSADTEIGTKDSSHFSVNASALKADYNAEAFASTVGVGVAAGVSVSAFTASEEAQLGNSMLGVYEKAEVSAGKLDADIKGMVGFFDQNGDFNPGLYGGISAEALAGEAKATLGTKVLGTDLSATLGVNYGIGAHANVGFVDGKLSVDVGATLGVGVSAKFDIDVSGSIKALAGAAKSAVDFVGGLFY